MDNEKAKDSRTPIRFIDLYTPAKEKIASQIFKELAEVTEKSQFILGEAVIRFESQFAKMVGRRFAVGCNSGLDALLLPLRALGIGAGDEVITAPNSFVASAAAIQLVGAKTVFADVRDDFNIDPEKIAAAITSRTKAIMPVHLTGYPSEMDSIRDLAKKHNLFIIEDAAQAIGAEYEGKPAGALGTIGSFSLHPLKNLHVWGDGGMMVLDDPQLYENLKKQRNHGLINRDEVEFFSFNSRLDSFQAVVGFHMANLLPETTERRQRHAQIYDERLAPLADWLHTPLVNAKKATHVYHVYQVRAVDRDNLKLNLEREGIETKIHYPIPLHLQPAAKSLGYKLGDFPVTERLSTEILSLPVRESLEEADVHRVCDVICQFYRGRA